MKKVWTVLNGDWLFKVFSFSSIGLITASFIVPPTGIIDPSVFAGVGEIFAFAALYEVHRAIDKGLGATIQHNNTTITVRDDDGDTGGEEMEKD